MNKADDGQELKWWSEFEGIVYPQWAPALVWRALMRWLPSVFATDPQQALQPEMAAAAAGALKLLMRYPFALDVAYRSQRSNLRPGSPELAVAQQFLKLVQRIEPLKSDMENRVAPSLRQLIQSMSAMFQEGANANPQLAQSAMKALSLAVPQSLRSSWDTAVEIDLRALYPLTEEKVEDLKDFLVNPLWLGMPSEHVPSRTKIQFPEGEIADSEVLALLDALLSHATRPLAWDSLIDLLSRPDEQTLTQDQAAQIEALASDQVRMATLLARMALNDRTRLDLAAAPSAAGFREALDKRSLRRADLPALEQRLASELKGFVPNPAWLAWVQTVHRSGLESILAELKSWLPGAKSPSSPESPSAAKSTPVSEQRVPSPSPSKNARPSTGASKSAIRTTLKKK